MYRNLAFSVVCIITLACTEKNTAATPVELANAPVKEEPAVLPKAFTVRQYDSAVDALKALILAKKTKIVAFGEIHQSLQTRDTPSALNRFSETILPILGASFSDLVVETWRPVGCGQIEKKVVAEVNATIERPKATENEVVGLLKQAKKLGVQPHILKVSCDAYKNLLSADAGALDPYLVLKLIARLLKEKALAVFEFRRQHNSQKLSDTKAVAIYGGAIHNDPHPEEGWEEVVFGPKLLTATAGSYVAIDLYVPEYVESDALTKEANWYTTYKKYVSQKKVTLIKINKNEYHLILKSGLTQTSASSESSPKP